MKLNTIKPVVIGLLLSGAGGAIANAAWADTGSTPAARAVRMSATGDYRLPKRASVVSDVPGYNSWPMIQAVGDRLICSYSRDRARPQDGHTRAARLARVGPSNSSN